MNVWEVVIVAVGLSMDALAVSVCLGLGMKKATIKKALVVGLYFGIFQGAMPLIGYFVATLFADKIIAFDHWIAFGLLLFLGGKMIISGLEKKPTGCFDRLCPENGCTDRACPKESANKETSLLPAKMLPFALATSIDALAVGVSFAFLKVEIFSSVALIGAITLLLSMAGVKIGNIFGEKIKSKAELAGGIILILIGIKILIEHLI